MSHDVVTGAAAFHDFTAEHPGVFRKITAADLPAPYATSTIQNGPTLVPRPPNAMPQALPGFKVQLYAGGLDNPRELRTALYQHAFNPARPADPGSPAAHMTVS